MTPRRRWARTLTIFACAGLAGCGTNGRARAISHPIATVAPPPARDDDDNVDDNRQTHDIDEGGTGDDRDLAPANAGVLSGKVVAVDPGHDGGNFSDPSYINHLVWNGRSEETCDTTGAATDAGYTEAQFNFQVAQYLTADLEAEGAHVVLTRATNIGVGPCVDQRAAIGNAAHADAAISIHADGGPARRARIRGPRAGVRRRQCLDRGPVRGTRNRHPRRVPHGHGDADEHLRRGGRHPVSERPRRAQPVDRPQGAGRMRQYAQL